MVKMKKTLLVVIMMLILALVFVGCQAVEPEVDPPEEPADEGNVVGEDPVDPLADLPASMELEVTREGLTESFVAHKTIAPSGLIFYLFPEFALTEEDDREVLAPTEESVYLPVSINISNNGAGLSLNEALEKAKANYPDAEFREDTAHLQLTGNMQNSLVVTALVGDNWVLCGAMESTYGTVSFWGEGNMETAEGLRALLLCQIASAYQ